MGILRVVLDLFILAWPVLPKDSFNGNEKQVDEFTFRLAKSKIQELDAVSTTAALIAGVVATLYSWPTFDQSPWPAHVFIGTSFVLSILSVRKAFQLSYVLRRLELHSGDNRSVAGDEIRLQLAKKQNGRWIPSIGLQRVWNCPVLYLNLATIALLAGYAWAVLAAAAEFSFDWSKRETKIAVGFIAIGSISIPHYWGTDAVIYSKYMSKTR